jgi:dCTP deaminase
MIQKSDEIAKRLRQTHDTDPLVITPTPEVVHLEQSGAAAVDLRLGTWFMNLKQARTSCLRVDIEAGKVVKTHYVPFGGEFILHPRTFVLASTLEWIRLPRDLAAYVVGKSSWGRRGLIIATATGVHPGFTGCLTLELSNVGEIPVEIQPGMQICQLFLHSVATSDQRISRSAFSGMRRPVFSRIVLDDFARKLASFGKPGPDR